MSKLISELNNHCTCNSRTVDETFSHIIHSVDCNLYKSPEHAPKSDIDTLIEWMDEMYPNFNMEDVKAYASQIKNNNNEFDNGKNYFEQTFKTNI